MSWEQKAEAKRAQLLEAIPEKWRDSNLKADMAAKGFKNTCKYLDTIVPAEELAVTKLTLVELKSKIADGSFTALQVAEAYCHRAALAQQILNCCSEIFFDKALATAKELDEYYTKTGKTKGELHGIPISLKDQVDLPGFDSAIGYVSLLNQPKTEMSLLAEYLQSNGAVFYVKTTVPMAMMAPETESNTYGYTFNSQRIELTSGGSSGGEGSLIGAGASPLGFGTDIGGSIRIPAAFNGLHALKPSNGRISYLRVTNSYCGQETMPSVIGPMARSLGDVEFITKFIIDGGLWELDPKVLAVPYQDHEKLKSEKLTIGVWKFDGKVMPHPPIVKAIEKASKALADKGHDVFEITLPDHDEIINWATEIYTADQGFEVQEVCKISGEPVVPCVASMITTKDVPPITVNPWWDICNKHYYYKQKFLDFWKSTAETSKSGKPVDAIIAPVWPSAAYKPGTCNTLNYSCPFNFLDCACVVLPISTISKEADPAVEYEPTGEVDKQIYELYDPEVFDGMTACIQVVGKHLQDEKTIAIATVIESCLA